MSFTVNRGEFVAIVGASGSGKSTLLHMIGGVDTVSDGEIRIQDVNLHTLKGDRQTIFRRQHISIIYQFYNLLPILNLEENIILPMKLNHQPVDMTKVNFLINLLNLQGKNKNLPSQLSGSPHK